jgi:peptide/nickel transport system ATP-binding protein
MPDHPSPSPAPGPALEAIRLTKHFRVRQREQGWFSGPKKLHAVDDVSITLHPGTVTALVGESGSGKSTIARLLARLYPPTSGTITLFGRPVAGRPRRASKRYASQVQLILQDPFSSLNPAHTIRYHLTRPLLIHGYARHRRDAADRVAALLAEVSLVPPQQFAEKFPHELSGGQRQRAAIARALAARPSVLLADEPVSMLDVSIRLGVLNLLGTLARERNLAVLYITHDIASARYFASSTLVMYAGRLVEGGPSEDVTQQPAHPYAQLLLASAPDPGRLGAAPTAANTGEPPSLIDPPSGCRFHPRCPHAMPVCAAADPPRAEPSAGHWVHCWLHVPGSQYPAGDIRLPAGCAERDAGSGDEDQQQGPGRPGQRGPAGAAGRRGRRRRC